MLFNSYEFIFLFLPAVLLVYHVFAEKWQNLLLTLASYIFYAYWDYRFCALIFISTLWDFFIGEKIFFCDTERKRKIYLSLSVLFNLGLLGYFKYANFFLDSLSFVFPNFLLQQMNIILPIGISFYTFQTMSYSIDIYYKKVKPVKQFTDFACYISLFPQLIAGPIVRYSQIEGQLSYRKYSIDQFAHGLRRFVLGLAKKLLIADTVATVADAMFKIPNPTFGTAWLGAVSFSLQIYFDFSGYSDMAIGLGRMFGFDLPENFHFPYQAKGISDFWRRWHMSLSYWLRDYLYIPLGGSRCSVLRNYANLMITMLICGLWHGASWNFFLWGGYFGVLLITERIIKQILSVRIPGWGSMILTYLFVLIGWVFFRAESVSQIADWLKAMCGFGMSNPSPGSYPTPVLLFFIFIIQFSCWIHLPAFVFKNQTYLINDIGLTMLFIVCVIVMMGADVSPFLYYQF